MRLQQPCVPSQPHASLGRLRLAEDKRRGALLTANLHKAVSVQVRAALLEQRQQRLVVTDGVPCCVCGRRLGNVAFAALPGGGMAHVGCVQGKLSDT